MSQRLLFRACDSESWEPVTAIRVVTTGDRDWVAVVIERSSGERVVVLPSSLHLDGSTFFGFLAMLSILPGWQDGYRDRMLSAVAAAHGRRVAVKDLPLPPALPPKPERRSRAGAPASLEPAAPAQPFGES